MPERHTSESQKCRLCDIVIEEDVSSDIFGLQIIDLKMALVYGFVKYPS